MPPLRPFHLHHIMNPSTDTHHINHLINHQALRVLEGCLAHRGSSDSNASWEPLPMLRYVANYRYQSQASKVLIQSEADCGG